MSDEPKTAVDDQGRTFVLVPESAFAVAMAIFSVLYLLVVLYLLFQALFMVWAEDLEGLKWLFNSTKADASHFSSPIFKLLAYAIIGGAMGGVVNGIRSFLFWHCDLHSFGWRYVWKYVTLPFMGAALALFVYALVRAGMGALGGGITTSSLGAGHSVVVLGIGVLSGYGARNALIWLDIQVGNLFAVKLVTVPDVLGKSEEAARNLVEKSGLTLGTVEKEPSAKVDQVLKQDPQGGAQIAQKVPVNITVGSTAEPPPPGAAAKEAAAKEAAAKEAAAKEA